MSLDSSVETAARALVSLLVLTPLVFGYFGSELKDSEPCFCQLQGSLDDCSCNVDTVDYFNNVKVFPRLHSLLTKNYFRFYKVNLQKECPFWTDDSRCAMKYCHVEACHDEDIPPGLKEIKSDNVALQEEPAAKYTEDANCNSDHNEQLSYINTTISAAKYEEFEKWSAYDDAQDNFCVTDDLNGGEEYVDLLLNPERYTGYKGASAHRIWRSIYMENCFRPKKSMFPYIESIDVKNMCIEKRAFYRVISGLHSSINIHLCSKYLLSEKVGFQFSLSNPEWGPNLDEFQRRFDPSQTNGEGPNWLKNLYFVYLLEMRAIAKAGPYLDKIEYYTGNEADDAEVRAAVKNLLGVVYSFPNHFNETAMFSGGDKAIKLKDEFRQHFRNISRIMDCVGCDKCKLWGKLQVQGLGTALKILFSGKFDDVDPTSGKLAVRHKNRFQLDRREVVALFNGFGRLATSIRELEDFRKMLR
ncbi:endoplasmic reticulum oxidoreductin-1-like protein [Arctopsyche grandis]|uniref:endoplasmic reticulum oxidoreductin-1-like protein n=1 Tax=Arctopsyche grandis TaxID=121162 RepID=UPI00406D820C